MAQRQILRQLAEVGRLRLQDLDDAALVHLLRDELVTVAGQTVTLTDKGRRRVAPTKTTIKVAKPLHPLTPLRRNYPVGRREQPSKRGYYAAEERSRREVAEWMERHGPPPIDWSNPDPERQKELRELARLLSAPLRHDDGTEWAADDYFRLYLRAHLDEPEGSLLPAELPADQAADGEPNWHGLQAGRRQLRVPARHDQPPVLQPARATARRTRLATPPPPAPPERGGNPRQRAADSAHAAPCSQRQGRYVRPHQAAQR